VDCDLLTIHSRVFCDLKLLNCVIVEAIRYSFSENIMRYVWNSNVQPHGHKNPSVGRILSHPPINALISQVLSFHEVLRPNSCICLLIFTLRVGWIGYVSCMLITS
jgi:hypothetical protein